MNKPGKLKLKTFIESLHLKFEWLNQSDIKKSIKILTAKILGQKITESLSYGIAALHVKMIIQMNKKQALNFNSIQRSTNLGMIC